jgi:hypothetical protein
LSELGTSWIDYAGIAIFLIGALRIVAVAFEKGMGWASRGCCSATSCGRSSCCSIILAFLAFDVAGYRHLEDSPGNYVAHSSGFATGARFRILCWKRFSTEKAAPSRKLAPATRGARRP